MGDLSRFIDAQASTHDDALRELTNGRKLSHWSWWEIPQICGLGTSPLSRKYAIADLAEAKAYLHNETLRMRLLELCKALLALPTDDAHAVLGSPDDMKLRSCMTLFDMAEPECETFGAVLDKFFGGAPDERTIELAKAE